MDFVNIHQPCPGCGKLDKLVMHSRVVSHVRKIIEYFVGCNCGWVGPTANNPIIAVVKWEARVMIMERAEAEK